MQLAKHKQRSLGVRLAGEPLFRVGIAIHHPRDDVRPGAEAEDKTRHGLDVDMPDRIVQPDQRVRVVGIAPGRHADRVLDKVVVARGDESLPHGGNDFTLELYGALIQRGAGSLRGFPAKPLHNRFGVGFRGELRLMLHFGGV